MSKTIEDLARDFVRHVEVTEHDGSVELKVNGYAREVGEKLIALRDALAVHRDPWRPEVRAFATAMEAQLAANDHKPGWKADKAMDLLDRLDEEVEELRQAIMRPSGYEEGDRAVVSKEAADVGNFAMMISDVSGGLAP